MQSMTSDDKSFITGLFKTFESSINGQLIAIKELVKSQLDDVKKDLQKHTEDLIDIFKRIGKLETAKAVQEVKQTGDDTNTKDRKKMIQNIIVTIIGGLSLTFITYLITKGLSNGG